MAMLWQSPVKGKKPRKVLVYRALLIIRAVRTGLEPATPCVTGRYSNQLNYRTVPTAGQRCRLP